MSQNLENFIFRKGKFLGQCPKMGYSLLGMHIICIATASQCVNTPTEATCVRSTDCARSQTSFESARTAKARLPTK